MANIAPPIALLPIVDERGVMSVELSNFLTLVADIGVTEGTGSPEGVVSARVTKFYMDTAGTAGSILYVKRDAAVGGDDSQGWILV